MGVFLELGMRDVSGWRAAGLGHSMKSQQYRVAGYPSTLVPATPDSGQFTDR
jgi:hypothetical protein